MWCQTHTRELCSPYNVRRPGPGQQVNSLPRRWRRIKRTKTVSQAAGNLSFKTQFTSREETRKDLALDHNLFSQGSQERPGGQGK